MQKLVFCVAFSLSQAQERSFSSLLFDPFEFRTSLSRNRLTSPPPQFEGPVQNIQKVNTQPQGTSERDFVQLKDFDSLFKFENKVKPVRNPRPVPRVSARHQNSKPRKNVPLQRLPTTQSTTTTTTTTTTTKLSTTTTTASAEREVPTTQTTSRASMTTRTFNNFNQSSGTQRRVLKKIRRKPAKTSKTTASTTTTISITTSSPKTHRVKFRVASTNSRVGHQLQHSGQQSQASGKSSLNQQQLLNLQSFLAHQNKPKGETFPNFPSA